MLHLEFEALFGVFCGWVDAFLVLRCCPEAKGADFTGGRATAFVVGPLALTAFAVIALLEVAFS